MITTVEAAIQQFGQQRFMNVPSWNDEYESVACYSGSAGQVKYGYK